MKRAVQFEVLVDGDAEFHEDDFEYTVESALKRRYPQFVTTTKLVSWAEVKKETDDGVTEEVAPKPEAVAPVSGGASGPLGTSESGFAGTDAEPKANSPISRE